MSNIKIFNNNTLGTTTKNFDFIFCDFIKQPIISSTSDNISNTTHIINITLKLIKKMNTIVFSKLFI